jgi:hypothetical protein
MDLHDRLTIAVFGLVVALSLAILCAVALGIICGVPLGVFFLLWEGWSLMAPTSAPHPGYWEFSGSLATCTVLGQMFFGCLRFKE